MVPLPGPSLLALMCWEVPCVPIAMTYVQGKGGLRKEADLSFSCRAVGPEFFIEVLLVIDSVTTGLTPAWKISASDKGGETSSSKPFHKKPL